MKRIARVCLIAACVFTLTACGSDDSDIDFKNDTDLQKSLLTTIEAYQSDILSMTDEEIETYLALEDPEDEVLYAALESWTSIEDAGEYESGEFSSMEAKLYKSSATYTCVLHFSERDVDMEVSFEDADGEVAVTAVTYTVYYSFGEKLAEAGMNTVMGICIVFIVLVLISFIISLFKYIPVLTEKFTGKKNQSELPQAKPVSAKNAAVQAGAPEAARDEELAAVIAAAIAASEGTSTDDFVVRTIKKRGADKWRSLQSQGGN